MDNKMPLYECHITCDLPLDPQSYEMWAKGRGWKTSCIQGDPLLGKKGYFYFTTYHVNLDELKIKMHEFADFIGKGVLRKKIEMIVYDTKKQLAETQA